MEAHFVQKNNTILKCEKTDSGYLVKANLEEAVQFLNCLYTKPNLSEVKVNGRKKRLLFKDKDITRSEESEIDDGELRVKVKYKPYELILPEDEFMPDYVSIKGNLTEQDIKRGLQLTFGASFDEVLPETFRMVPSTTMLTTRGDEQ